MICLICRQAEIVNGFTSVTFEYDDSYLTINRVPARVCPGCGEEYVDEEVAIRLLQGVREKYKAGMMEEVIEYERL